MYILQLIGNKLKPWKFHLNPSDHLVDGICLSSWPHLSLHWQWRRKSFKTSSSNIYFEEEKYHKAGSSVNDSRAAAITSHSCFANLREKCSDFKKKKSSMVLIAISNQLTPPSFHPWRSPSSPPSVRKYLKSNLPQCENEGNLNWHICHLSFIEKWVRSSQNQLATWNVWIHFPMFSIRKYLYSMLLDIILIFQEILWPTQAVLRVPVEPEGEDRLLNHPLWQRIQIIINWDDELDGKATLWCLIRHFFRRRLLMKLFFGSSV